MPSYVWCNNAHLQSCPCCERLAQLSNTGRAVLVSARRKQKSCVTSFPMAFISGASSKRKALKMVICGESWAFIHPKSTKASRWYSKTNTKLLPFQGARVRCSALQIKDLGLSALNKGSNLGSSSGEQEFAVAGAGKRKERGSTAKGALTPLLAWAGATRIPVLWQGYSCKFEQGVMQSCLIPCCHCSQAVLSHGHPTGCATPPVQLQELCRLAGGTDLAFPFLTYSHNSFC